MSKRFHLLYALVIPAMLLSAAAPALAKGAGNGGKKPVGTIVSFDGTTLTIEASDGSTLAAPVSDDVQIKVAHRGRKGQDKTKKPSNGTEANLVPGASVLRLKMKCGEVVKLRVKAAPPGTPTTTETEADPSSTGTPVSDFDPECEAASADEDADGSNADESKADESDADDTESEDEAEDDAEDEDEEEEQEDPNLVEEVVGDLPL